MWRVLPLGLLVVGAAATPTPKPHSRTLRMSRRPQKANHQKSKPHQSRQKQAQRREPGMQSAQLSTRSFGFLCLLGAFCAVRLAHRRNRSCSPSLKIFVALEITPALVGFSSRFDHCRNTSQRLWYPCSFSTCGCIPGIAQPPKYFPNFPGGCLASSFPGTTK